MGRCGTCVVERDRSKTVVATERNTRRYACRRGVWRWWEGVEAWSADLAMVGSGDSCRLRREGELFSEDIDSEFT